ncbi:hypothetical protein SAMN02745115_00747 [[Eubacterium] yurii]|jgi:UPF0122 protein ABC2295|nr:hypothetical protein SAMN02745115_00747 [[Eubacterium] yurii]
MEIDRIVYVNELLDLYGNLLTEKQREVMFYYFSDNLSFGEIGLELGISRQAVSDTIKKSEQLLYFYEDSLKIYEMQDNILSIRLNIKKNLLDFKEKHSLTDQQSNDIDEIIKLCEESKSI